VDQSVAMTGSLSVRGEVLPVGGVTPKVEAAAKAGMTRILVPKDNEGDVMIEKQYRDMVQIIPVSSIGEVLENSLIGRKRDGFLERLKKFTINSHDLTGYSSAVPQ
jgi:ATP-dependent Lon protease